MTISAFDSGLARELRQKINAEVVRQEQIVVSGSLKSYEDYRATTGRIAGMGLALSILEEIEKRMTTPEKPKPLIRNIG